MKKILLSLLLFFVSGCAWLGGTAAGFQAQCDKLLGLSTAELVEKIGMPSDIIQDKTGNASVYHYFHFYWTHCSVNFIIQQYKVVSYSFEGGDCLDYSNKPATHPILKEKINPKTYTPQNRVTNQ